MMIAGGKRRNKQQSILQPFITAPGSQTFTISDAGAKISPI
jgi:hypothetical protein